MPLGTFQPTRCAFALLFLQTATFTLLPNCPPECICLSQTQVLCNSGGLQEIPKKLLPPSVEHLSLTRNNFPLIKSDSFSGLRFLRKLSLDGNNISIIKPFAFRGLPRLKELSIQETPLATVAQFAFAGLQNISAIYLSHNKIKKVESYAFAGTSNLRLLVLTNNPLYKIERHAFSGLNNVERINLPSGIREIEPDAFDGLDTVGYIKLAFMDLPALSTGIFRGLTNVGLLSIQESDLGTIDGSAFNGMTFIKTFTILNNKIDAIEYFNITEEQKIGHLKFQGNHILEIPKADSLLIEVEKLTVISNHFPCNCHIHSLLEGPLTNGSIPDFISKNFCISPLEVNGLPMNSLDVDSIGRCEEEVTKGNLEASKDSTNNSYEFKLRLSDSVSSILILTMIFR
ncbi:slit homolog 3 protein-like [Diorhabda sublineata]|uniref:slit homolog 3 protein-like n=1 Tax=Diorhabda sublineata TaxID=1163346 RepID=UPI0024E193FA|nr:slit homolog 3 protein-like [Diorhabda sublineata]